MATHFIFTLSCCYQYFYATHQANDSEAYAVFLLNIFENSCLLVLSKAE